MNGDGPVPSEWHDVDELRRFLAGRTIVELPIMYLILSHTGEEDMNNLEWDEEHHMLMTDREDEYPEDDESICQECNGEGEDRFGRRCRGCRGSGLTR